MAWYDLNAAMLALLSELQRAEGSGVHLQGLGPAWTSASTLGH